MHKTPLIIMLVMSILLTGCATSTGQTLTPLEKQILQTREYEQNKDIIFPAVVSVFQDIGYIIQTADKETGLITAEGAAASTTGFFQVLSGTQQVSQTRGTAFIETIDGSTKVRLNFVVITTLSSTYGQSNRQDSPILDAAIYQNAFERIENAIFIRSSN